MEKTDTRDDFQIIKIIDLEEATWMLGVSC